MLYKTIIIQLCTVSVAKKSWLKQCLKMETTCTVMLTNILIIVHGSSGGNSLSAISRSKWNFVEGGDRWRGRGWAAGDLRENKMDKDGLSTKTSIHIYFTSGNPISGTQVWVTGEGSHTTELTRPAPKTAASCYLCFLYFLFPALQHYRVSGGRNCSFYKHQWLNELSSLYASESHCRGGRTGTVLDPGEGLWDWWFFFLPHVVKKKFLQWKDPILFLNINYLKCACLEIFHGLLRLCCKSKFPSFLNQSLTHPPTPPSPNQRFLDPHVRYTMSCVVQCLLKHNYFS